jgi:hypothetical protein
LSVPSVGGALAFLNLWAIVDLGLSGPRASRLADFYGVLLLLSLAGWLASAFLLLRGIVDLSG